MRKMLLATLRLSELESVNPMIENNVLTLEDPLAAQDHIDDTAPN